MRSVSLSGLMGRHRHLIYYRVLPLLVLLTVALGATRWRLGTAAPWRDEVATWSASTRSPGKLWDLVQTIDVVHLVYYFGVHLWSRVFGDSYLSLRLLSAVGILVAVVAVYLIGIQLAGLKTGFLAAGVFIFLPLVMWATGEARSYSWVMAAGALTVAAFLWAMQRGSWWRWGLFGLAAAWLTGLFIFASLALLSLPLVAWLRSPRFLRPTMIALVAAALAVSPLLLLAMNQQGQVGWLPRFSRRLVGYAFGEAIWPAKLWLPATFLTVVGIWLLIRKAKCQTGRWQAALLLSWLLVPTIGLLLLTIVVPSYYPRYVGVSMPALALVFGVLLAQLRWRHALVAAVTLALLQLPLLGSYRQPAAKGIGWYNTAKFIANHKLPNDCVIYDFRWSYLRIDLAFPKEFSGIKDITVGVDRFRSNTLLGVPAGQTELAQRAKSCNRIWLVGPKSIKHGKAARLLARQGFQPAKTAASAGVTAWLMSRSE